MQSNNHRISIEENNDHDLMLFGSSTSTTSTTAKPNFVTPVTKTTTSKSPMMLTSTVSTKMPRSPKKPKKMYTEPTSEAVIEQLRKDYRKRVKHVFKKDPPSKKKKSRLNSSKYTNQHLLNGPTPIPPVATTATVSTFKPIRIKARGKLYSKRPAIRFLEPDTVS